MTESSIGPMELVPTTRRGMQAISRQIVTLDPGGVRLFRGLQLVFAVALAAVIGAWAQHQFDAPKYPPMALNAAVVALKAMVFTLPGPRWAEVKSALLLSAVMLVVYCSAILVNWGDLGLGPLGTQIAWIGWIAVGFYMRRFGSTGFRCGVVLALAFIFVVVFEPTRQEAVWWLLAIAIGAACAVAVYLLAWRPSPVQAFDRLHARLKNEIVATLIGYLGDADGGGTPTAVGGLRVLWARMARASDFAAAAAPADRRRLESLLSHSLRMVLALEVVVQQIAKDREGIPAAPEVRQAIREVVTCLGSRPDDAEALAAHAASVRELRLAVLARHDLANTGKLELLRTLTGLVRIIVAFGVIDAAPVRDAKPDKPDKPAAKCGKESLSGHALGLRLALQASVSAAVVVALGAVFDLQQTFWATLTIIVVLSASWGATIRRTLQRVPGVVLGVLLAVAVQWLIGSHEILQGVVVALCFIPIFVVMDRHFGIASFLIGMGLATGVSLARGETLIEMLAPGYETAIGGLVCLFVAKLLFPIPSADQLRPLLRRLFESSNRVIRLAAAGPTDIENVTASLQRCALDLADEMANLGSERLLTRASGPGTRELQAHADALATYVPLFAQMVSNVTAANLPESYRTKLDDVAARLSDVFERFPRVAGNELTVGGATDAWEATIPLDGTVPARDVILLVEALYCARKCFETLSNLKPVLAAYFPERVNLR
jgi:uncharacterized membrane protein YgaE (UPF0421/DUF939 family)